MQKNVRFYINQAKGLTQKLKKEHPNISDKLLNKFVKSMQTETYIFDCRVDENGSVTMELFDVQKNKLYIPQQEVHMRKILQDCAEYAKNGRELPTAVTGYQIITE